MFFYVSKIIWFLTAPSTLMMATVCLGALLLFTRFFKAGRVLVALGALGFLVFGSSPVPRLMIRELERRFPPAAGDAAASARPVDGIIVLGGALDYRRGQMRLTDAGARVSAALALAHHNPEARVVFTGGHDAILLRSPVSEAEMARDLFQSASLSDSRVIYEGQSRNTHENALFTAKLVTPQPGERWLLVTSAFHMPRAMGTFRAAGFDVEPYPVDFRADDSIDDIRPFRMVSEGLRLTDLTVREAMGLIAYRLKGYTDALLPSPTNGAAAAAAALNRAEAAPAGRRP
ncbi:MULTISPECIES: YdcF family protein [unclassified Chelatococcus]|uniref:YdcF family protein n=1 Tax=unclassified Chelatococcus TaxID=2638111 RepID=UPI001BCAA64A|nr:MULTISPECIES: YdcF family protein [unclassified Chelatococcus]MBS7698215.1 YdcF family protein [Chelatococcus sp. YT9]MBX3559865.1 YdcF family protein [Chelatococcus sp.]